MASSRGWLRSCMGALLLAVLVMLAAGSLIGAALAYAEIHWETSLHGSHWRFVQEEGDTTATVCIVGYCEQGFRVSRRIWYFTSVYWDVAPTTVERHLLGLLLTLETERTPNLSQWTLICPSWLPSALCVPAATLALWLGPIRRWRRQMRGGCPRCGYNLTGNVTGRCPECGAVVVGGAPARAGSDTTPAAARGDVAQTEADTPEAQKGDGRR